VRFVNGLLTFVLVLMLLMGSAAYLFDAQVDSPGPLERAKTVIIAKGKGTHEIAEQLEREGIVTDRRLFIAEYLRARFAGQLTGTKQVQLRAGDYAVKQNASIRQVLELLSEGKTVSYRVMVPEGLTSHQIVERLKAEHSLSGDIDGVPAEGTLLPDTYVIEQGMPRQALIDRMQAEARKIFEKAWMQRRKDLPLKSMEEAVVLASIVEKETGRNDERERVAAVFINRMKQNMRLQSDPTILYGISGGKTNWGRPSPHAHLQPRPRCDRGGAQSLRYEGALFRRRRHRRPPLRRDAQRPQRQRPEVARDRARHPGQDRAGGGRNAHSPGRSVGQDACRGADGAACQDAARGEEGAGRNRPQAEALAASPRLRRMRAFLH
jgi:cell division protein YceG involved in septum cleavage